MTNSWSIPLNGHSFIEVYSKVILKSFADLFCPPTPSNSSHSDGEELVRLCATVTPSVINLKKRHWF